MTNFSFSAQQCKLLFSPPKSDFGDFLWETLKFWDGCEPVRRAIEADLRIAALAAKHQRERERQGQLAETLALPGLELGMAEPVACSLELEVGRPRMPAKLVFAFCMIRGWLGSVCSADAQDFMQESQTLSYLLEQMGIDELPSATSILENVNSIRPQTLALVHRMQLQEAADEKLDDFETVFIDSTSVHASSSWPTDSKMLYKLLERVLRSGDRLEQFGLNRLRCSCSERWIEQVRRLDFEIALLGSKAQSKKKRRKLYREIYLNICKLTSKLMGYMSQRVSSFEKLSGRFTPLRREAGEGLLESILVDLKSAGKVLEHSMQRIEEDIGTPARERVLSIADASAAIIVKGDREPVLGYKPQLARSGNGYVSALIIEEGNGSDSHALEPMVQACIENTGKCPKQVSVDDGYAWKKAVAAILELGVEQASISGSKGKRLLGEELWNEPIYRQLRAGRSSAESLMYVLKHHFFFDRMGRRGIEPVRSEMFEKIIAYNFSRTILLRRQRQKEEDSAKAKQAA